MPYSFPPECDTVSWNITIKQQALLPYDFESPQASTHETFLYIPETADYFNSANEKTITDYYSSCFRPPPGEATLLGKYSSQSWDRQGVYRDAVCPQGWAALNVGLVTDCGPTHLHVLRTTTCTKTWSTAMCCKSGDQVVADTWRLDYLPDDHITSSYNAWVCAHIIPPQRDLLATVMEYYAKLRISERYTVYTYTVTNGCSGGPDCTAITQDITSPIWSRTRIRHNLLVRRPRIFTPSGQWNEMLKTILPSTLHGRPSQAIC